MTEKLYVYGTLRPGNTKTVFLEGTLYDLGPYPGIILGGPGIVACEILDVDDWDEFDRYEGFRSHDPENSLYIRRPLMVPYGIEGWIYEYNRRVDPSRVIESGDWISYRAGGRHGRN